ncbi:MAG: hypothetical protein ACOX8V_01875 [Thermoleophilia bacterium]
MSTRTRIVRSLYATSFGQVVTVLVQLAGVPLFIYFWGVDRYGEWLMLSAISSYISMSDFGFASVAANDMTMSVAQGRRDKALKTLHSTLVVILLASAASGLAVVVIILLQVGPGFLPTPLTDSWQVAVVVALLWAQVIIGLVGALVNAGYRCEGNFARGIFGYHTLRLGEFAATACILAFGGGFVAAAIVVLATRVIGTGVLIGDLRRCSPWITLGLKHCSRSEIKRLLRPALAFMAFPLGNALSIQGFTLVVGWTMGAMLVPVFSTHRTMTRIPFQMMGMINQSFWPELSISFGKGETAKARRLHRLAVGSSIWIVFVSLVVFFVAGEPIMRVWSRGGIVFDSTLFLVLGGVVLTNSLWSASSIASIAVNRHQTVASAYLLGTSAAVALAVGLAHVWGLAGIGGALIIVDAFVLVVAVRQAMVLTQDRLPNFALSLAMFPLLAGRGVVRRLRRFKVRFARDA